MQLLWLVAEFIKVDVADVDDKVCVWLCSFLPCLCFKFLLLRAGSSFWILGVLIICGGIIIIAFLVLMR